MEGTDFKDFKAELLKDPEVKNHYDSLEPKYAVISALIARRNELSISQRELAHIVGMKQPAICRLESGEGDVKLGTLFKVAEALNMEIGLHTKDSQSKIVPC